MNYVMEQVGRLRDEEWRQQAEHARMIHEMRRQRPSRRMALPAALYGLATRLWHAAASDEMWKPGWHIDDLQ